MRPLSLPRILLRLCKAICLRSRRITKRRKSTRKSTKRTRRAATLRGRNRTRKTGKKHRIPDVIGAFAAARHVLNTFKIIIKPNTTSVVRIVDSSGKWIMRFDKAHKGANFPHINLDKTFFHLAKDPHVPIGAAVDSAAGAASKGSAALAAVQKTAGYLQKANKVLLPLAIAFDTVRLGFSIAKDVKSKEKVPKNSIKTGASIAGGWGFGYGGAIGGAVIGSAIFPGIGTIVGGVVGALTGGIGGSLGAEAVAGVVVEAVDKKIKEKEALKRKKDSEDKVSDSDDDEDDNDHDNDLKK